MKENKCLLQRTPSHPQTEFAIVILNRNKHSRTKT